jgi:uncharacterized membrane protein YqhA
MFRVFTLEGGLAVGLVLLIAGVGCAFYSVFLWDVHGFGAMNPLWLMRVVACAVGLILMGVQVTLYSLFVSILGLARK